MLLQMKSVSKKLTKTNTKLYRDTIATELDAQVSQIFGHTVLLYQPADISVLDFEGLE